MSLRLHLPLNGLSGSTTPDVSGNGNNGTPYSGSFVPTGKFGACWENGASSKINIGSGSSLDVGNVFTLSVWIYPTALAGRKGIYSERNTGEAGSWMLEVGTGSGGTAVVAVTSNGHFDAQSANGALTVDVWNHVVFRKSDATTQSIFINGVASTLAINSPISYGATTANKFIGSGGDQAWASTYSFIGKIDEVKLFDTALSDATILAMAKEVPTLASSLLIGI